VALSLIGLLISVAQYFSAEVQRETIAAMKLIDESASVANSMRGSALSVGDEYAKSADALQQALAINVDFNGNPGAGGGLSILCRALALGPRLVWVYFNQPPWLVHRLGRCLRVS